ncbi:MAG: HAMP domain-containing protein [Actinobacteria bacterium]|nr:HAMP domain-containing protein [Actinomycetota bacterium]
MTRRLLFTYLLLTAVILTALEIPLGILHARTQTESLAARVERDASTLATLAEERLEAGSGPAGSALATAANRYTADTGGRFLLVDRTGKGLLDTAGDGVGRSFASRPEISNALAGELVTGVRRSDSLGTSLLVVAVPVASGGRVLGVVRVSFPTAAIDRRVRRYWLILAAVAAVILATAAAVGYVLARWVVQPIADLGRVTAMAADGKLDALADEDDGPPEVRRLARSYNQMVARLDDLLRSQVAFVADASHQLRTPLTALRLRLENLERQVDASGRTGLDGALAEVTRLTGLVNGLLALARSESQSRHPEAVHLAGLVDRRKQAWDALAAEHGVTIALDVVGEPVAWATPSALEQVLDNLISNSLTVSPVGGRVTLAAADVDAGSTSLRVIDEGPGMTPEDRVQAFDRFWRGRATPGFGLGLAIVQRLVSADSGSVTLADAQGGGLEAIVLLPAHLAPDPRAARAHRSAIFGRS